MKFSVVIPLYNKEKHITRAIFSVINQTYKEFEIIVIDDGSTDNSVEEVIKLKDARIRLIKQKNCGVSSARNKGINESKYKFIGFLDADDSWEPTFLETIKNLIEKYPRSKAYATSYNIMKDDMNVISSPATKIIKHNWEGIIDDYFKYSLYFPMISASSVVVMKSVFKELGGFPLNIRRGEDLHMWCRIALNFDIAYSNQIQATYFYNSENRACNNNAVLEDTFANQAEEMLLEEKKKRKISTSFEEYMIKEIIIKATLLIDNNKRKEARQLLYKYRYTKLNKKTLITTYILSWTPKTIKSWVYNLKFRLDNICTK
ncbi:MAG: glycosyltransferase family 2 protein [Clostridia bacterium]